ncbi:hypothetical protein C5Y96_07060 [Blastopirellula marina]|uniref:DUF1883 domain-containing protein n=1 Tax=Blastopirellula marina TaxID=124 RepID=A0A2S8FYJ1_9BACT|nr:hypothetical protein C5Y96_07060 [Blastopirellula marina]RCS53629.1 DUF1883 domain-containing protein [Bremerella cremea]
MATQSQQFLHYPLGHCTQGKTVEVTLSSAANVQLLDANNFALYKSGSQYRYHGGYVTKSPYRIRIPSDGNWHIAIDLGGAAGHVKASVQVI